MANDMADLKEIYVLNGPNLNLLGTREPEVYGSDSLSDIEKFVSEQIKSHSYEELSLIWFQSNIEGEIVEKVQEAIEKKAFGILINPAAYTHTSVAIHDALKAFKGKKVEVHLSNTNAREEFRKNKITTEAVDACVEGFGKNSYLIGLLGLLNI